LAVTTKLDAAVGLVTWMCLSFESSIGVELNATTAPPKPGSRGPQEACTVRPQGGLLNSVADLDTINKPSFLEFISSTVR
jgi:hypothetical protein